MSMRNLHLGVLLPFDTAADCRASTHILRGLLGFMCLVNHRHLLKHPSTPHLYESGVVYAVPDQAATNRISSSAMQRVAQLLRSEGADEHTARMVLQYLDGVEEFLDIPALYARGCGDCNELVPVRVAELWRADIQATPYLVDPVRNAGGGLSYHAIVVWPDGTMEDPSLILGMGGAARAADRQEARRQNKERWDNYIAAAKHLLAAEGANPAVVGQVGRQIDMMGLLPRSGRFVP